jgi:hypothetical protein
VLWQRALNKPGWVTQPGGLTGARNTCGHTVCESWSLWTVQVLSHPPIPHTCVDTTLLWVMSKKHQKYPWPRAMEATLQVIGSQLTAGGKQRSASFLTVGIFPPGNLSVTEPLVDVFSLVSSLH